MARVFNIAGYGRILGDEEVDYNIIETKAATIPIGAAGVVVLPFGNGAERLLGNRNPGGANFKP